MHLIRVRGGSAAVSRRRTTREIIDAIGQLTGPDGATEWHAQLGRAHIRHQQALIDHGEAAAASTVVHTSGEDMASVVPLHPGDPPEVDPDEVWPDYDQIG